MKLQFFIIRDKTTGRYLPPGQGRNGRGTTHQDLIEPCEAFPPRLFHTRQAAQLSLNWWLKGVTSVSITNGYLSLEDYDCDENWHTEPREDRKKENMEIVRVELCL